MRWHEDAVRAFRARREEQKAWEAARELPFVSVVMTHYKRPGLCWQALESLEVQDYPKDKFEVILIDDGSPDEESKAFLDKIEPSFQVRAFCKSLNSKPFAFLDKIEPSFQVRALCKSLSSKLFATPNPDRWRVPRPRAHGARRQGRGLQTGRSLADPKP